MDAHRQNQFRVKWRRLLQVIGFMAASQLGGAAEVTLAWDPVPEPDVAGYVLYYGGATGVYTNQVRSTNTSALVVGLVAGQTYFFSVAAVDPQGRQGAPSSEVVYTIPDSGAPPGSLPGVEQRFVIEVKPGRLRNDFTGFVGMRFTTGDRSLRVNALGRLMVAGNKRVHLLKLVEESGVDLKEGAVAVAMAGGAEGEFVYGNLRKQVVLAPRTTYYLVSGETHGGDHWHDANSKLGVLKGGTVQAVYRTANLWTVIGEPNHAFGPLNFKYLPDS